MYLKKIVPIIMTLLIASQVQATSINGDSLKQWSISQKEDAHVTRQACRELLENTIGNIVDQPELLARPKDYITREEMTLMIVDILGYEGISAQLSSSPRPFEDIQKNIGAITIMKDLKLISGDNVTTFNPNKKLTTSEVTAITQRIYDKLNASIDEVHSSYAIKSSDQMALIKNLDAVSFGWSQVEYDKATKQVSVNITSSNQNDFNVPIGFEVPLSLVKEETAEAYLMVYLNNKIIDRSSDGKVITLAAYIFNNKEERARLIDEMIKACNQIAVKGQITAFDGLTIDFENFYDASLKAGFNTFLKELNEVLKQSNKKLNVALQPSDYYKGYDYKTIGQIADRVILMAHDYAPKALTDREMQQGLTVTPITPIPAIYKALKEITNAKSGIDPSKVMLQISFASTQWQVKDNKIINRIPFTPSYDKLFARLQNQGTQLIYSKLYQNPYAIYYDGAIKNVIWYENAQSVEAKIDLAKMFGVHKISLWRLGTIPDFTNAAGRNVQLDITAQQELINDDN